MDLQELKESKEYKKAKSAMSEEAVRELIKKEDHELKEIISKNTVFVKGELEKLKNTPEYIKASETISILNSGIKEAINPYRAAIDLAALILKERK